MSWRTLNNLPPLGHFIRGCRMGFYWSHKHNGFIRISGSGPFLIECCPTVENRYKSKEPHRVWMEDPDILLGIKPLERVTRIRKHFEFWVDDVGELVASKRASQVDARE